MAATFTKIATVTVGSGGASSIDFSSIPATYTDICLKVSARSTATGNAVGRYISLSINGVTTNRNFRRVGTANGSTVYSDNSTSVYPISDMPGTTSTATTFTNTEVYFPNYAGSNNKSFSSDFVSEDNATTAGLGLMALLWSSTSAINQLTLTSDSGNFAQYTTATLYGISNS